MKICLSLKEKGPCYVNHYEKFTIDGRSINGTRTKDENIADATGLSLAKLAYDRFVAKKKNDVNARIWQEEPPLPGLERFTTQQLFYIAFAQGYCANAAGPSRPDTESKFNPSGIEVNFW